MLCMCPFITCVLLYMWKVIVLTAIITILIILLIEYIVLKYYLNKIESDAALMFKVNTPMCVGDLTPTICAPFNLPYKTGTDDLSLCQNVAIFIGTISGATSTSPGKLIYWSGDTAPIAVFINNMIIFRGTMTAADLMADLQVGEQTTVGLIKVHKGFNDIYQEIKPQLPTNIPFVAGHSLGCALAVLYAFDNTTTNAVLIAPPRTGNYEFVAAVNSRVTSYINIADIVPTLPPNYIAEGGVLYEYSHAGKLITFNSETTDMMTNHSTVTYYNELLKLQTTN